ncbi:MAG: hypothetical protein LAO09_11215 [Acidobacteriia bacterium]|nr:hypothetical protein [Terriglobia bacterium]
MSATRPRPRLPKVSEQMKAWAAALTSDLETWPQVTTRPMFGFTAWYRKGTIFAVLPKTRGMETPNSLAFKLPDASSRLRARLQRDARIGSTEMQKARWFTFELSTDADLHDALEWLGQAYEEAR